MISIFDFLPFLFWSYFYRWHSNRYWYDIIRNPGNFLDLMSNRNHYFYSKEYPISNFLRWKILISKTDIGLTNIGTGLVEPITHLTYSYPYQCANGNHITQLIPHTTNTTLGEQPLINHNAMCLSYIKRENFCLKIVVNLRLHITSSSFTPRH